MSVNIVSVCLFCRRHLSHIKTQSRAMRKREIEIKDHSFHHADPFGPWDAKLVMHIQFESACVFVYSYLFVHNFGIIIIIVVVVVAIIIIIIIIIINIIIIIIIIIIVIIIIILPTDIDECKASVKPCTAPKLCSNTFGSYTCPCPAGYTGSNCETGKTISY